MNADEMLSYAGDFNKYQFLLMILFAFINILASFQYFAQTFISIIPKFSCKINNTTHLYPKNNLTSMLNRTNSSILHELVNDIQNNDDNEMTCQVFDVRYSKDVPCEEGWNYDLSFGYSSIIDELNWVCEDSWKPVLGQSLFFIGSICGSLILGILADKIGRLHILVIANMFSFIGNIITLFANELIMFAIGRLIAGIATDNNFVMMYIIVMEYIRPSMRNFGLNFCIGVFYCIGCVTVPWLAALCGTWRIFLITISAPLLIVLTFYILVPESAQWLISKGKTEEAINCFKHIAKVNNKNIPVQAFEDLKNYCSMNIDQKNSGNLLGLFKTPNLRRKTCILIFKSMVITLCYDAISRNINGLGFSPFILFSITSATILPACLVLVCLQDIIGRKGMACSSLLVSGIFTSAAGVLLATTEDPSPILSLCLSIISRFGINVAYNSGAQYAVELVPTEVRGQGVAAIHVVGYAATFFSSPILYLGTFYHAAPDLVLGILSVLGAIACVFLPETCNKTLPITLKDGEEFGEEENTCEFMCFRAQTGSRMNLFTSRL